MKMDIAYEAKHCRSLRVCVRHLLEVCTITQGMTIMVEIKHLSCFVTSRADILLFNHTSVFFASFIINP